MSPDQRQREPSQEKKKLFGGKKNVSNPFGLKKDPKKSEMQPVVTLGNVAPVAVGGVSGLNRGTGKAPQPIGSRSNVPEIYDSGVPKADPSASDNYEDEHWEVGDSIANLGVKMQEKRPGGQGIDKDAMNTLDKLFGDGGKKAAKKDPGASQSSGNPAFEDNYEDDFDV